MSAALSVLAGIVAVLLQQAPARDRAAAPAAMPAGTASVSGMVLTGGDDPQPVRHAGVTLSMGAMALPQVAITDDEGRFVFEHLAAGSYRIGAQKPTWVPVAQGSLPEAGMAGLAGLTGAGVPVVVKDGEAVRDITLRLQRGGVLSGVVRVPGGGVAAGMSVQALRASRVDGTRSATITSEMATTDDRGRYRIYGLAPGEYVVQVRSSLLPDQLGELRQVLPSEVHWAEVVRAQAGAGLVPGLSQVTLPPPPDLGPTVSFSTTYFPGTAYLSDAAGITLRSGEERLDIDIDIRLVPTTVVSGHVNGVDGRPAGGALVTLALPASTGQEELLAQMLGAGRTTSRPDGSFVMTGVPPGSYLLTARAMPPAAAGERQAAAPEQQMAIAMAAAMAGGMLGGTAGGAMSLWAQEPIDVSGQPVGPIGLQLREGLKVSGSVVFEGAASMPASARVTLSAATGAGPGMRDLGMLQLNPSVGQVRPDGTFELGGIVPGRYRVSVLMPGMRLVATEPGDGWMLKSARLGDRDLADDGVDLTSGADLAGVVVTMTRRPSELSGRVLDGAGRPFSAFPLVVFSAGREHWKEGSRRVTSVQPATDGSYVIAGLPPGQYYLAVVTEVDPRELGSPAFLESLIPSALSLTLSDGERKTQDVRLSGST